ncbi:hypothetical protein OsI_29205 [Oryza sativa Indica Group]|uniref:Uncharacterized protein n=1 Tax=Oryza sativa subsp. indica TaxID=39946 RepID=B8BAR0_ORYSI|nr:hypothetical protein OsI_29205 [Oryza sativa Indica Group]
MDRRMKIAWLQIQQATGGTGSTEHAPLQQAVGGTGSTEPAPLQDAALISPPQQYRSSHASTQAAESVRYPVDEITQRTACELVVRQKNLTVVVAYGMTKCVEEGKKWHCNDIPHDYVPVEVEQVVTNWEDLELDIPGGDGETKLGQCSHCIILWSKADVVIPGTPAATNKPLSPPRDPQDRDDSPGAPDASLSPPPKRSPSPPPKRSPSPPPRMSPPPPPKRGRRTKAYAPTPPAKKARKTREKPAPEKRAGEKTLEELEASVKADTKRQMAEWRKKRSRSRSLIPLSSSHSSVIRARVNRKKISEAMILHNPAETYLNLYKYIKKQNYCDSILIPYNIEFHWFLIILCPDRGVVNVFDSLHTPKEKLQNIMDMMTRAWIQFRQEHPGIQHETLKWNIGFPVPVAWPNMHICLANVFGHAHLMFNLKEESLELERIDAIAEQLVGWIWDEVVNPRGEFHSPVLEDVLDSPTS